MPQIGTGHFGIGETREHSSSMSSSSFKVSLRILVRDPTTHSSFSCRRD